MLLSKIIISETYNSCDNSSLGWLLKHFLHKSCKDIYQNLCWTFYDISSIEIFFSEYHSEEGRRRSLSILIEIFSPAFLRLSLQWWRLAILQRTYNTKSYPIEDQSDQVCTEKKVTGYGSCYEFSSLSEEIYILRIFNFEV